VQKLHWHCVAGHNIYSSVDRAIEKKKSSQRTREREREREREKQKLSSGEQKVRESSNSLAPSVPDLPHLSSSSEQTETDRGSRRRL
jgi:hypothetical protein